MAYSLSFNCFIKIQGQMISKCKMRNIVKLLLIISFSLNACKKKEEASPVGPVIGPLDQMGQFNVTSLAGDGNSGLRDGFGSNARFKQIAGIATDQSGFVYVADKYNNVIRKISPSGMVTTIAGSGNAGSDDGIGTAASFNEPEGLTIDNLGNVYVADTKNCLIRKITPTGVVTTIAGSGCNGTFDGLALSQASLNAPKDVAFDASGNLYIADFCSIRKLSGGYVSTFAGRYMGSKDGTGTDAEFNDCRSLTIDSEGNIYVTDFNRGLIRKVTPLSVVTTFAGSGNRGFADGKGTQASFHFPTGIDIDPSDNLYIADGDRIRKISPNGKVTTILGGIPGQIGWLYPYGISIHGKKTIYFSNGNQLLKLSL